MTKKILWGSIGALLLAVAVFGGKTVLSYAATGKRMLMREAQARVPFSVEVERLRTMVAGLDDTVLRHEKKLIEQEVELEHLQREVSHRETDLRNAKGSLERVRSLLAENRPVYVINGSSYSADTLRRDALGRVDAYRTAAEVLEVRQTTCDTMGQAVELGRRQIQQARLKRQQYEDMISRLQAENVKLQAKKELAATVGSLELTDATGDFEAAQSLYDRLHKRIEVENRMIDARLATPLEAIPLRDLGAGRDPLREIDAVLDGTPAADEGLEVEAPGAMDDLATAAVTEPSLLAEAM